MDTPHEPDLKNPTPEAVAPMNSIPEGSESVSSPKAPVDSSQLFSDHAYEFGSDEDLCPTCGEYHDTEVLRSVISNEYDYETLEPEAPKDPMKPFLTSFELFPKLPTELREMIWRLTLEPRAVGLQYSTKHGFYSKATLPVALKACPDSRKAIIKSYSLCFGSLLHAACIFFNFELDTLYFDIFMQPRITQFIVGMSKIEAESIRSIGVDIQLDEYQGMGFEYESEDQALVSFKVAAKAMPALEEFLMVYNLDEDYDEHGLPWGSGPVVLFDKFPYELRKYVWLEGHHVEYPEEFNSCGVPADYTDMLEGIEVPKKRTVFGWQPTALLPGQPLWPYPSMFRNSEL